MLDNAEEAVALIAGKDKTELKQDRVLELALIRLVEIIGEVSAKVSSETQVKNPLIAFFDVLVCTFVFGKHFYQQMEVVFHQTKS